MNCRGKLICFDSPKVMGILNLTEDSFSDGGLYFNNPAAYLFRIENMLAQGADIIDIGCMATNPNAKEISEDQERQCMEEALAHIMPRFPDTVFSIDTWRTNVAKTAVEMGVSIINDISGGSFDQTMFSLVAQLQVPYILMHTTGRPNVMQQNTAYTNLVADIFLYLSQRLDALRQLGVNDVIVDPGFGFGKQVSQNYTLLKQLHVFKALGAPLLVGLSRKTMLYKLLNTTPLQTLNATTVVNTIALLQGADIVRVHDVKEAVEVLKIVSQWQEAM
ncbi:MAG: dihydropteroate synthase [Tannerella sp.]|nr:dihydropteroate synthase [Tannerella sp.]